MNDATLLDQNTLANGATHAAPSGMPAVTRPSAPARTTVLPRLQADGSRVLLHTEARSRYEPSKVLGAGGMGEVVLVSDHDIGRKVAVKRLLPELNDPSIIARFVDEIRTVGRLEHPNIVPIHDVGVDEEGRYFFVMKYVAGETLESIIEKLKAGDPAYMAKYTIEARVEIFKGLMHALEYAHTEGVVHRDIKPANVMVGHFGEVVLMDWGIAKPVAATRDAATLAEGALNAKDTAPRAAMFATRVGTLIGTPAYMSPEQACGDHAKVDRRSDLFSAIVLFHELLGLDHYLDDARTLDALLEGVKTKDMNIMTLVGMKRRPPAELLHVLARGFQRDPERRYQSAAELIAALEAVIEGRAPIQCQFSMTKRTYRELGRLVDRSPWAGLALLVGLVAAVIYAGIGLVRYAMHFA
jgi:eukaryotic-like serine/threonine-protein kinase